MRKKMIKRHAFLFFILILYSSVFALIIENNKLVIETDNKVGTIHDLGGVAVYTSQHGFLKKNYVNKIKKYYKNITHINCVRSLGGRKDGKNQWFKGVDKNGDPICDFSPYLSYMEALVRDGYTPMIVLDNVPTAMSKDQSLTHYGNSQPPLDFKLWYKYVRAFMLALKNKFGLKQISTWRYRVHTEPDLFPKHWEGTKKEYFEHYDNAVAAVESVIPEPDIGPGNILMLRGNQDSQDGGRWGLELFEKCANGKNIVTGKTGTRMSFIGQSIYGTPNKPFYFEENMIQLRKHMEKYPTLKGIPYSIQEYGLLAYRREKELGLPYSDHWFAGFYAHTIDVCYRYNVRKIYTWGQATEGLYHPYTKIIDCLDIMKDGDRVFVKRENKKELIQGAIAAWKGPSLYVITYSHFHKLKEETENNITLELTGNAIAKHTGWQVDEYLLDKDNGIWIHEMYNDIESSGISPKDGAPYYAGWLTFRYGKKNINAIKKIIQKNKEKYLKMGKMKKVTSGKNHKLERGKLSLQYQFLGNGFRFLKISPAK
jgi:xylan 1,4-beta-xylosidase